MTTCDFETTLLTKGQKTSGCAPGKFMLQNSIGYMQLRSERKKYQLRWISIYQASAMETNSHLCISNSLTHRQMSPPGTLYLSADRFLEKKKTCTLEGVNCIYLVFSREQNMLQVFRPDLPDLNRHFPAKINGPTFNFSCYICDCMHLL